MTNNSVIYTTVKWHATTCLATEAVNFTIAHPHTPQAGLMLYVRVLLPVYEPDEGVGL